MKDDQSASLLLPFPEEVVTRLVNTDHQSPHSILGAHPLRGDLHRMVIRGFHPEAVKAEIVFGDGSAQAMEQVDQRGLFAALVEGRTWPYMYRIRYYFSDGNTWERIDPYRFLPTIGDMDLYLFGEGTHQWLYDKLGAHPRAIDGVDGVGFAVWAPNARRVSVVGDFNRWDGRLYPMRNMGSSGVWELFVPGIDHGDLYKYEIKTTAGELRIKTDPMAFAMELRPKTASMVWDQGLYKWSDDEWIKKRSRRDPHNQPMLIYEVHLGSWRKMSGNNGFPNYREIAGSLVEHLKRYGFNYVEFLPVAEHPFDASWGYQVTGYYAPTSRFGTPDDFKYLVDLCHQNGIGVILDWVPAHFPRDDYALRWFDGTALYEHADPRQGEHPDWGTLIFNFGRNEVRNFLLANALFWLNEYHIDGLRIDAVASMLYLDYSRNEGEWIPNKFGGRENLEAIDFLRKLNESVYAKFPGCFTVAEESTAWGGVTLPTYLGGLGFGFKWDMGWMNDTLVYFSKDPVHRKFHHNQLTFSIMYTYSENFILPLSHDEVVHGKGSLLGKMPGDLWRKLANLRLLLAYQYTHPGGKLVFMGTELAPEEEWSHDRELPWYFENDVKRLELQKFMMDLGWLYQNTSALWAWDHRPEGFRWIDCQDADQGVVSYVRTYNQEHLVVVFNLTPVIRENYRIGVPINCGYVEVLNSDSIFYGGSDVGNAGKVMAQPHPCHGYQQSVSLMLPPLGCVILKPEA